MLLLFELNVQCAKVVFITSIKHLVLFFTVLQCKLINTLNCYCLEVVFNRPLLLVAVRHGRTRLKKDINLFHRDLKFNLFYCYTDSQ